MTYIRTTERSISTRVLNNLQNNLGQLAETQQRMSSGKMISVPSDSPTGTASALQLRGDVRVQQQYQRNVDDALGWLGTIDTALSSATTQLNGARDLVLQGISSGTGGSADAREALATEIDNIRSSLIGVANTSYLGRPVFGGTTGKATAYDAAGAYTGDGGAVVRSVGDNTKIPVNGDAAATFGTGTGQLFTVLSDIAKHLREDPSALTADLARLDTASERVRTQAADVGARQNRVTQSESTVTDRLLTLKGQLSNIEDIDLPQTVTDLKLQETAYQASLAATARVVQPSLMDFLR
ncbi:flagellin N-terminal helical domain-containing protein [Actinomadura hibisca]|uniref:flagellin N-terminal helical domain-containing protein n=1 Tax=Actinomadura hibisca TaxID=68565 RepID=UPI000833369F|nr:flagellin [Actinomadura hibisca]